ncbi:MAG TPA: FHA domain-containing protein [Thermoanaerobaculia bacterium]|nr:FHA domain-containing protein [Thermoanaerobaculia bacterium]
MIVACERCHARYHYDEARFEGKPSKRLRCSRCRAIFEVVNTRAFEVQPTLQRQPPDETMVRRSGTRPARPAPRAERPPATLALPPNVKLSLAVIAGPDAGRMFVIEKPRVVLGREDVDVVLEDPEVSRQHAAIEVAGDRVTLVDLGSANGTLVGDAPIEEATLENQGEFSIGGSTLMLIVTAAG